MSKEPLCVTVELKGEKQQVNLPVGSDYNRLLEELQVNPEEVLIFVDNVPVPFDAVVESTSVRVLKVVSGG